MRMIRCVLALFVVASMSGCAVGAQRQFAAQVKNKPAPDFELTALDGGKVRLSDQRGKPVIVAFFAFNCPPCRAEAPHLSKLAEEYKKDGLVVLAVNAWDEDKDILKQYVEQNKLNQRVLLNGGEVCDRYGIPDRSVPIVFWVDRSGLVVDVDSGNVETLEGNTKKLVNSKS